MKDTDLQVGAILAGPSGQQWRIASRREASEPSWLHTRLTLEAIPGPGGAPARKRLLRTLHDLHMKVSAGTWRLVSKGSVPL